MNMQYLRLILGCTIIVLVFIAGCSSTQTPVSSTRSTTHTQIPEPTVIIDTSTVTHAELMLVPEKWDSDAEYDGVMLSIAFLDKDNKSLLAGQKLNFPIDIEKKESTGWNAYANTTLEKVDQSQVPGNTRVSGNTKLRIEYDPPMNGARSVGIVIKIHLPDGRIIETPQQTSIQPTTS
jgi:hypothetical protein